MRVFFTDHIRKRLREREIPLTLLYEIVLNPDYVKQSFGERVLVGKKFNVGILELVCVKKVNKVIAITIYFK